MIEYVLDEEISDENGMVYVQIEKQFEVTRL